MCSRTRSCRRSTPRSPGFRPSSSRRGRGSGPERIERRRPGIVATWAATLMFRTDGRFPTSWSRGRCRGRVSAAARTYVLGWRCVGQSSGASSVEPSGGTSAGIPASRVMGAPAIWMPFSKIAVSRSPAKLSAYQNSLCLQTLTDMRGPTLVRSTAFVLARSGRTTATSRTISSSFHTTATDAPCGRGRGGGLLDELG